MVRVGLTLVGLGIGICRAEEELGAAVWCMLVGTWDVADDGRIAEGNTLGVAIKAVEGNTVLLIE